MKISVIIPVYNASSYIVDCLCSVGQQTYGDVECIIVDDCGSDDSIAKTEKFISDYKGNVDFRIITNGKIQGVSVARNNGLKVAKGDYIVFVDSDDKLFASDSLSLLADATLRYPDAELILASIESNVDSFRKVFNVAEEASYSDQQAIAVFLCDRMSPWARIIKRSFLVDNNITFHSGFAHEDNLWSFHIAVKTHKVAAITDKVYYYNVRVGSEITGPENEDRRIRSLFHISKEILSSSVRLKRFDFSVMCNLLYVMRKDVEVLERCGVAALAPEVFSSLKQKFIREHNYTYYLMMHLFSPRMRGLLRNEYYMSFVRRNISLLLLK